MTPLILEKVSKTFRLGIFKTKKAVIDLSLKIESGQVIGLLGPNGSGKSTTLKMILGFLKPSEGNIKVCGFSPWDKRARAAIGYLPENPRFQRFLTANQILNYYGILLGLNPLKLRERIGVLLDLVNLTKVAHERVQGYSKGMTQRLAIAQALLNEPKLLILDEPMSGLDPVGRIQIRQLISSIHDQMPDSTILFSTHIVSDAEDLCSNVILLKAGKLVRYESIESLWEKGDPHFEISIGGRVPSYGSRFPTEKTGHGWTIQLDNTQDLISELNQLREAGASILGIHSKRSFLERSLFSEDKLS